MDLQYIQITIYPKNKIIKLSDPKLLMINNLKEKVLLKIKMNLSYKTIAKSNKMNIINNIKVRTI